MQSTLSITTSSLGGLPIVYIVQSVLIFIIVASWFLDIDEASIVKWEKF